MGTITPAPVGLVLRPYAGEDDVPATVLISNAEHAADRIQEVASVEERLVEFGHPNDHFDARRDVTIAEMDGQIVGFSVRSWVDTTDAHLREYRFGGAVHPDWRRRGIGGALLAESERLARQLAASHQTDRAQVFGSMSGEHQHGDIALLEGRGYRPVRWFFEMARPSLDDIPELTMPEAIAVRDVAAQDVAIVWRADVEAFRDHWGGFDDSEESMRRFVESPSFDPSLWVIAFDGDDVAGGVINAIYPDENRELGLQRGWLDSVFTRRPWRRRGLARALIARSLEKLRARGMTSAVLGVDADNPTGALGLYQSLGFEVTDRATAWRRPME